MSPPISSFDQLQCSCPTKLSNRSYPSQKKISKVVKLRKSLKIAPRPIRHARLTRRKPSPKQSATPNTSLLLIRARYYNSQLGQFISRDPLGYVDGMSQYWAYFVPGATDAKGTQVGLAIFDPFAPLNCIERAELQCYAFTHVGFFSAGINCAPACKVAELLGGRLWRRSKFDACIDRCAYRQLSLLGNPICKCRALYKCLF